MTYIFPRTPQALPGSTAPHGALRLDDPMAHAFGEGTTILTLDGALPVEELQIGDRVITRDRGAQPLLWIERRVVSADEMALAPNFRPVRVKADAIAPGFPVADCLLSPHHQVVIRGAEALAMFGAREVVTDLLYLQNGDSVTRAHDVGSITYVQLCFASPQVVYADGLEALTAPEGTRPRRRTLSRREAAALA